MSQRGRGKHDQARGHPDDGRHPNAAGKSSKDATPDKGNKPRAATLKDFRLAGGESSPHSKFRDAALNRAVDQHLAGNTSRRNFPMGFDGANDSHMSSPQVASAEGATNGGASRDDTDIPGLSEALDDGWPDSPMSFKSTQGSEASDDWHVVAKEDGCFINSPTMPKAGAATINKLIDDNELVAVSSVPEASKYTAKAPAHRLRVANIPSDVDDSQIEELLKAFGRLKTLDVVRNNTDDSDWCLAFCEYVNDADACTIDDVIWSLNTMCLKDDHHLEVTRVPLGDATLGGGASTISLFEAGSAGLHDAAATEAAALQVEPVENGHTARAFLAPTQPPVGSTSPYLPPAVSGLFFPDTTEDGLVAQKLAEEEYGSSKGYLTKQAKMMEVYNDTKQAKTDYSAIMDADILVKPNHSHSDSIDEGHHEVVAPENVTSKDGLVAIPSQVGSPTDKAYIPPFLRKLPDTNPDALLAMKLAEKEYGHKPGFLNIQCSMLKNYNATKLGKDDGKGPILGASRGPDKDNRAKFGEAREILRWEAYIYKHGPDYLPKPLGGDAIMGVSSLEWLMRMEPGPFVHYHREVEKAYKKVVEEEDDMARFEYYQERLKDNFQTPVKKDGGPGPLTENDLMNDDEDGIQDEDSFDEDGNVNDEDRGVEWASGFYDENDYEDEDDDEDDDFVI